MAFKKNRVQLQNPKTKQWVLVDTKIGKILKHNDNPLKGVRRIS